jgi:cyclase
MRRIAAVLIVATGFAVAVPFVEAQDFSDVTIKATAVRGSVHMLTGAGGNLGVSVGDDGVFLIDDQFAPLSEKIKAAIATISAKPVKFLVNTHWHGDHVGGNENFGKDGAIIVAHDNVRKRMSTDGFIKAFNREVKAAPKDALPVVTFADSVTLHLNGETMKVIHVDPAHTDGDSVIFFEQANVLHTGDLFFNGLYPFIDLSSGGNIDGVIAAAARLIPMVDDETKIIPGHGPLATKADYQKYHDTLKAIRDNVAKLVAAGKSMDEVIAAKPSAEFDAEWGNGFMKPATFLSIVYDSLKPKDD